MQKFLKRIKTENLDTLFELIANGWVHANIAATINLVGTQPVPAIVHVNNYFLRSG